MEHRASAKAVCQPVAASRARHIQAAVINNNQNNEDTHRPLHQWDAPPGLFTLAAISVAARHAGNLFNDG